MTDKPTAPRVESVDMLRGVVMVLMVLDHTRDFFSDVNFNPTDLARTTTGLFLTRWVTHFCAPVFALLAGTGAYLAGARGMSRRELARFLVTRGLWLVFLEQTVESFGLTFWPTPGLFLGLVLWSLGWSMVALGVMVAAGINSRVIGAVGVVIMAGHNLLDGRADLFGPLAPVVRFLHEPGLVGVPGKTAVLFSGYPLLPWFGVVAAGYGLGEVFRLDAARRFRILLGLGVSLTVGFVLLRGVNAYGDPVPWAPRSDATGTLLAFINCLKYPPSLLFLMMTLGPALIALAWFDRGLAATSFGRPLVTLGRVPLFYYLAQWYVIHGLAVAVALASGKPAGWLFSTALPPSAPPESQYGLPVVYLMWGVVVAILYGLSVWFGEVKRRNRGAWWVGYV
ncbi:MAG: heparan-alpha-glucosaminide N-acetyltransferase domain-containing protein [Isosphaeraceae bacterium]